MTRIVIALVIAAQLCVAAHTLAADAPASQPAEPTSLTRVYDIRDLMMALPDYPYTGAIGMPSEGPAVVVPGGENERPVPTTQRSRQQRVQDVIQLITETVDPDSWRDAGGTLGSVREIGGLMVVTQTEQNQRAIGQLLAQLREDTGVIRVQADWVVLSPAQVADLLNNSVPKAPNSPKLVVPAVLEQLSAQATHYRGEISCFSGQLVSFSSGRTRSVIYDQEAVVAQNAVAVTPRVKQVTDGLMLEVAPTVLRDANMAILEVKTKVSQWSEPTTSATTTRPSASSVLVAHSGNVDRLNVASQELKTMLRVPLNQPVLVGGMSLDPTVNQPQGQQLYLILQVNAGGQTVGK